jgi:hypothetical protein
MKETVKRPAGAPPASRCGRTLAAHEAVTKSPHGGEARGVDITPRSARSRARADGGGASSALANTKARPSDLGGCAAGLSLRGEEMEDTAAAGAVTSAPADDAGRAALAAIHEAQRRARLTPRERAELRDELARVRNSLPPRGDHLEPPDPVGRHGDVDINGDLVDQVRRHTRRDPTERERRLARCITAATPELASEHLACVLAAIRA